jgi:DNA-binding transcriptional ArsR family regulator
MRRSVDVSEEPRVSRPLYQLKAEFFKTLGHPARIRVLELLSQRDHSVAEMLPEVGIEPTNLSQQLAVLRRAGLVTTSKEGSTVIYSLTSPVVAELLAVARRIMTEVLTGQVELLEDVAIPAAAAGRGRRSAARGG